MPILVDALSDAGSRVGCSVKQISCGSGHTVVLDQRGKCSPGGAEMTVDSDTGTTGGNTYRAVEALAGKRITQVTCGSYHTAAVSDSGELFTWGGGMYGKLGHGDENGHAVPLLVAALRGVSVVQVACGSRHTIVLAADMSVYSWGDKQNGVSGHSPGEMDGHQYTPRICCRASRY